MVSDQKFAFGVSLQRGWSLAPPGSYLLLETFLNEQMDHCVVLTLRFSVYTACEDGTNKKSTCGWYVDPQGVKIPFSNVRL